MIIQVAVYWLKYTQMISFNKDSYGGCDKWLALQKWITTRHFIYFALEMCIILGQSVVIDESLKKKMYALCFLTLLVLK